MFFSVKSATKIAGKSYKPCICYPVTKFLEETVKKLSSTGKAVIYPERVFFQNGKLLVKTSAFDKNLSNLSIKVPFCQRKRAIKLLRR